MSVVVPLSLLCSSSCVDGVDDDLTVEQRRDARGRPEFARECGREGEEVSGDGKSSRCSED
jgi:hypothetical protein